MDKDPVIWTICLNGFTNEAVNDVVANEALVIVPEPLNDPVNSPVNEPLNEPVLLRNWSTRFTVKITEGIPGWVPEMGSASNLILVSSERHII